MTEALRQYHQVTYRIALNNTLCNYMDYSRRYPTMMRWPYGVKRTQRALTHHIGKKVRQEFKRLTIDAPFKGDNDE